MDYRSSSNEDDGMNWVNGAMVAPQHPPPIQPTTTETASTNDALSYTTAGTTPSPAVPTQTTTTTSTYKEYEDVSLFLMMRLAAMRPAHQ